jgi:hydrogenase-4 component F
VTLGTLLILLLIPLITAALAYANPSERIRPWLVTLGAAAHLSVVLEATGLAPVLQATRVASGEPVLSAFGGWLVLDTVGKVFLLLISTLFFFLALYLPGYLAERADRPNRIFCANSLIALCAMTLVTISHHLGLMWVAMEATTLVCGPLIYYERNPMALEATWKYVVIGSTGIALALLGTFFLAYSSLHAGLRPTLFFDELVGQAKSLSPEWLHAAFILLFIGYGTKMGLAPMHTWKPDAYGEAPGVVGAFLAGGVTSCSFLSILRFFQLCQYGPEAKFSRQLMLVMGLVSMAVAAVFMVRQRDYKRMLAYSSIEHMGILVFGIGIGGQAVFGALLHMLNNAFTKGVLFLSAGNIHRAYGTRQVDEVRGAFRRVPLSAGLFLAGFLAITGSPPFGPFLSEFTIASASFETGQYRAGALFLGLLAVIFVGMGAVVLQMVQGHPSEAAEAGTFRDHLTTGAPILLLMVLVLLLGVYIPPPLATLLRDAAASLEAPR